VMIIQPVEGTARRWSLDVHRKMNKFINEPIQDSEMRKVSGRDRDERACMV
jgi:hypothetical protein